MSIYTSVVCKYADIISYNKKDAKTYVCGLHLFNTTLK